MSGHVLRSVESGRGAPPVVFLHGVFMDHTLWDAVVDDLGDRRLTGRLVRLDMPGHGDSAPMAAGATLDDHVSAVAETLDAAGIRGAILVGHSWGGMVAVRLAAQRTDLVSGVVLSNTPLRRTAGVGRLGFALQRVLLRAGFPLGWYGRMAARALIGSAHRAREPRDAAALASRMRRLGRRQADRTLRSVLLEPTDSLDLVADLGVPWVAVAGRDDYVIADGVAARLAALGELRVVDGAHTTPLEQPAALTEAIIAVRDRLVTPARTR